MTSALVFHTESELREAVHAWRLAGQSIGFVPTMGNLHAGHLSLVKAAQKRCDRVIVSIFVNPTQFGPNEDFSRYPRTFDHDIAALNSVHTDGVFFPSVEVLYPNGTEHSTFIEVPELSDELCGAFRPGHFRGVATVVAKLFNLAQADIAFFGEKDYQQLSVIRRMVDDLKLPIEIVGVPTVRDANGLALSSRNQYLSDDERASVNIYETLCWLRDQCLKHGRRDFDILSAEASHRLSANGLKPQYVEIRRTSDLKKPESADDDLRFLIAAYLGTTRLIDNL